MGTVVYVAVYVPLLAPILAAGSARWLATRLDPKLATWLLTAAAVVLAAASGAALTVLAASAVGQLPWLAELGHWSAAVLRSNAPASLYLSLSAGLALTAALAAGVAVLRRRIAAILAAAHTARCLPGADQTVVLDDPAPDAYAVPGWLGRIVVSTGMIDALDARERRVLVAHERAHLECGHHLFVALADLAAATNPLLRPVAAAVRYSTERWADEHAAVVTGDRALTARTIGKAALLTHSHSHSEPSRHRAVALAITGQWRDRRDRGRSTWFRPRRVGPVPRRVAALLAPPIRHRPLLLGLTFALVLVTSVASLESAHDLHAVFELAHTSSD